MKTNKEKFLSKVSKSDSTWIIENDFNLLNSEEVMARTLIALKLRRYMKDNDLKQIDLAERLSVTQQYVNKILRGRENLTIHTALKFGMILDIKLIDISMPELPIKQEPKIYIHKSMEYQSNCFSDEILNYPKLRSTKLWKTIKVTQLFNLFTSDNCTVYSQC